MTDRPVDLPGLRVTPPTNPEPATPRRERRPSNAARAVADALAERRAATEPAPAPAEPPGAFADRLRAHRQTVAARVQAERDAANVTYWATVDAMAKDSEAALDLAAIDAAMRTLNCDDDDLARDVSSVAELYEHRTEYGPEALAERQAARVAAWEEHTPRIAALRAELETREESLRLTIDRQQAHAQTAREEGHRIRKEVVEPLAARGCPEAMLQRPVRRAAFDSTVYYRPSGSFTEAEMAERRNPSHAARPLDDDDRERLAKEARPGLPEDHFGIEGGA